jgi:hypothetical protein
MGQAVDEPTKESDLVDSALMPEAHDSRVPTQASPIDYSKFDDITSSDEDKPERSTDQSLEGEGVAVFDPDRMEQEYAQENSEVLTDVPALLLRASEGPAKTELETIALNLCCMAVESRFAARDKASTMIQGCYGFLERFLEVSQIPTQVVDLHFAFREKLSHDLDGVAEMYEVERPKWGDLAISKFRQVLERFRLRLVEWVSSAIRAGWEYMTDEAD